MEVKYPKMIQTDLILSSKISQDKKFGPYAVEISLVLSDGFWYYPFANGRHFFYPDEVPSQACPCLFILQMKALVYEGCPQFGTMEVIIPELIDSYFWRKD